MSNTKSISLTILLAGIVAMIFSGATNNVNGQLFPVALNGQTVLPNEILQQQQQFLPSINDPDYADFLKFMQLMAYYEQIFGKDYVTKVYKNYYDDDDDDDDDDNDNDNDKKKNHKKWWKDRDRDLDHKDGKKDKEWWEKEKAARDDHRCEEPGTSGCGGGNNNDDNDDKEGEEGDNDDNNDNLSKDEDSNDDSNDNDNEDSDDSDDGGNDDGGDSGGDDEEN